MKKGLTELEDKHYAFLERFLDVTKANLFFAKGILMVEGWAEEILLPALARKMKKSGFINKDLTEASVSIINVGSTAFLDYAGIFRRKQSPVMKIPVAIITDVDVPEYKKSTTSSSIESEIIQECEKRDSAKVLEETIQKTEAKQKQFDNPPVKVFIAPHWTLEYSIFKSKSLSKEFQEIVKDIHSHSQITDENFEQKLAEKLLHRSLDKTGIAYQLAQLIDNAGKNDNPEILLDKDDSAIKYLMDAIKYACTN